jgi:DegV family protein with EDD domain
MPREYVLSTETTCDLPREYYTEHGVNLLGLTYTINGKEYNSAAPDSLSPKEFFGEIANGAMPKTSQVTVEQAANSFEKLVKEGKDVLHLAFSSGLSGTMQSCMIAANEVMERFPGSKIIVVDSLAASAGEGLLLHYAIRKKNEGLSIEELAQYLIDTRLHLVHNFTVNDLFHLHRGGRVSKVSAVLGSALGIKPLLHVDDEGHLINVGKTRGRKQALTWLVDKMGEKMTEGQNDVVFISHSACYEDAKFVASLVTERFGIQDVRISDIGQVIGSHTGIGTVALFFIGDTREV